jgi:hypothetical protein
MCGNDTGTKKSTTVGSAYAQRRLETECKRFDENYISKKNLTLEKKHLLRTRCEQSRMRYFLASRNQSQVLPPSLYGEPGIGSARPSMCEMKPGRRTTNWKDPARLCTSATGPNLLRFAPLMFGSLSSMGPMK